jgi:multidrug resistance efflux pump
MEEQDRSVSARAGSQAMTGRANEPPATVPTAHPHSPRSVSKPEVAPSALAAPASDTRVVRRWTLLVLGLCALLFVYHLFADRFTPFTSQGSVAAFVVPIAPEVAGLVTSVEVIDNQRVKVGDVLVRIDDLRYRLAVAEAEATLAQSGQDVGAGAAEVTAAIAQLEDARAHLAHMRKQATRAENLVAQRALPTARLDQAVAAVAQAEAAVSAAAANVRKAQERVGPQGADNPRVRAALAALQLAQRQVEDTVVRAPSDGVITDLQIAAGSYAAVGRPLMTFIAADQVWVEAAMRENNLGALKLGDPTEIVLDVDPGRVHPGRVAGIGWGVAHGQGDTAGELPTLQPQTSWLQEARRFPVRIEFAQHPLPAGVRVGSQASVIAFTGDHPVLAALGWLRIRLESLLTYVY